MCTSSFWGYGFTSIQKYSEHKINEWTSLRRVNVIFYFFFVWFFSFSNVFSFCCLKLLKCYPNLNFSIDSFWINCPKSQFVFKFYLLFENHNVWASGSSDWNMYARYCRIVAIVKTQSTNMFIMNEIRPGNKLLCCVRVHIMWTCMFEYARDVWRIY